MKTISRITMGGTVAILALTLAGGVRGADLNESPSIVNRPNQGNQAGATETATPAQSGYQATQAESAPMKYNKASGIIGMEVQNQNDERLGRIKDVVFDLDTGRISYAVLESPGTVFGLHEKMLAVPLNALRTSADGQHLVLNADKAKVETAQGFDRENWPSVNSPSWGAEPFWEKAPAGTSQPMTTPEKPAASSAMPQDKTDNK